MIDMNNWNGIDVFGYMILYFEDIRDIIIIMIEIGIINLFMILDV